MTLAEATTSFLDHLSRKQPDNQSQPQAATAGRVLPLLTKYFSPALSTSEINPNRLRDFLGRWFVNAAASAESVGSEQLPGPEDLLNAISAFIEWAGNEAGCDISSDCLPVVDELRSTLPKALEITRLLSTLQSERRGAFAFPEFLTSFEEGGRSLYDLDKPDSRDEPGVLEGYFRITRVEGSLVEAEELITGMQVGSIAIPARVGALLAPEYVLNLEVVREGNRWKITDCGCAYPPGTEIF